VLKKVLVTSLGFFGAPRRHSAPPTVIWRPQQLLSARGVAPPCPPRYALHEREHWENIFKDYRKNTFLLTKGIVHFQQKCIEIKLQLHWQQATVTKQRNAKTLNSSEEVEPKQCSFLDGESPALVRNAGPETKISWGLATMSFKHRYNEHMRNF